MSASRESILNAVLAKIAATQNFVTIGRRNRGSNAIGPAQSPALFLLGDSERYETTIKFPRKLVLVQKLVYLNDVGPDPTLIPETAINNALDALDQLLVPDYDGRCTLGGLVYSALIKGAVKKAPGDATGKSIAIVPLELMLP